MFVTCHTCHVSYLSRVILRLASSRVHHVPYLSRVILVGNHTCRTKSKCWHTPVPRTRVDRSSQPRTFQTCILACVSDASNLHTCVRVERTSWLSMNSHTPSDPRIMHLQSIVHKESEMWDLATSLMTLDGIPLGDLTLATFNVRGGTHPAPKSHTR